MSNIIACFGEIMARIQPEGLNRIRQAFPGKADITFAGAEANVAASLQMLGRDARYVSAIPIGPFGDAAMDSVRRFGIDSRFIIRGQGRLGLYFVERGANQRASTVIYDRAGALFCESEASTYDWNSIFEGCSWFHISGITPAISEKAAEASIFALKSAKAKGLTVSCDLNFRKKLWRWKLGTPAGKLAENIMSTMLPLVDVVIGNEEDAEEVFGIRAEGTSVETGILAINRYPEVASSIVDRFPNVAKVAITLRESLSASYNNWGAMLYDSKTHKAEFAPMKEGLYSPYKIRNIVDRIGGGDSFAAGLVFALTEPSLKDDQAATIAFASAASCLCHAIEGDYNYVSKGEILDLMNGDASGRVRR